MKSKRQIEKNEAVATRFFFSQSCNGFSILSRQPSNVNDHLNDFFLFSSFYMDWLSDLTWLLCILCPSIFAYFASKTWLLAKRHSGRATQHMQHLHWLRSRRENTCIYGFVVLFLVGLLHHIDKRASKLKATIALKCNECIHVFNNTPCRLWRLCACCVRIFNVVWPNDFIDPLSL